MLLIEAQARTKSKCLLVTPCVCLFFSTACCSAGSHSGLTCDPKKKMERNKISLRYLQYHQDHLLIFNLTQTRIEEKEANSKTGSAASDNATGVQTTGLGCQCAQWKVLENMQYLEFIHEFSDYGIKAPVCYCVTCSIYLITLKR